MATRYGTVDSVKTRTGISHEDLGLDSDGELDTFLNELLDEATDLMDRRMRKSYLTVTVPKGLDGIANDIVADSLRSMVQSRQTPVVRIDDFAIKTIAARTLSGDVTERLKLYARGGGVASYDLVQPDLADLNTIFTLADLDAETP